MFQTFPVGSLFGIPLRCSWSFVAVLVLMATTPAGPVLLLALVPALLLHELGHAFAAKRERLRVYDIAMVWYGGMARMEPVPEDPGIEARVAVAGPLVNLVLALIALPLAGLLGTLPANPVVDFAFEVAWATAVVNGLLGTLNLVPAFPMDGGRILRAWFARSMDWLVATERAIRVGRLIVIAATVVALLTGDVLGLSALPVLVVAMFVWVMGARELITARIRRARGESGGDDGVRAAPVHAEAPRSRAPRARPRRGGARRPALWSAPERPETGYSDERVAELERFHGRLLRVEATER